MQRILDHLAQFIPSYYEKFVGIFCKLAAKFEPLGVSKTIQDQVHQKHANVRLRLAHIRQAFSKLEFRLLKEPLLNIAKKYLKNPVSIFLSLIYKILADFDSVCILARSEIKEL